VVIKKCRQSQEQGNHQQRYPSAILGNLYETDIRPNYEPGSVAHGRKYV
jgi:hypothetical protein